MTTTQKLFTALALILFLGLSTYSYHVEQELNRIDQTITDKVNDRITYLENQDIIYAQIIDCFEEYQYPNYTKDEIKDRFKDFRLDDIAQVVEQEADNTYLATYKILITP